MEIVTPVRLVLRFRIICPVMCNLRFLVASSALALLALTAQAGPLTEARVTKIFNKVDVIDPVKGPHAAALQETIRDEIELKTGVKSRSELLFQDQTLTRIGPETSFSFKAGTRDISLGKGALLLQVPKGLGGAKIRTAAVTAAITGTTIMIEHTPGKHIKVLVLEGSLRLSVNGPFGDSVTLLPGRMVLMRPDAKRIPPPVSVDLKRIVRTSSLINMSKQSGPSLPSLALIEKEIAQQAHDKTTADLVETGLEIRGSGTMALNTTGRLVDVLARNEQGFPLTVVNDTTTTPPTTTNPTPTPATSSNPSPTPATGSNPGPTPATGSNPAPTPATGSNPAPTPGPSPTPSGSPDSTPGPTPVPTASPNPSATPNPSGDNDDSGRGDHNHDGHPDNGKGHDGGHGRRPIILPRPTLDRARLSPREPLSPSTHVPRNDR